jgi:hypothetical protein
VLTKEKPGRKREESSQSMHRVFVAPLDFKPRFGLQRIFFSGDPFICFFFDSSYIFFFPSTLAPHSKRFPRYTTSLNDERSSLAPGLKGS